MSDNIRELRRTPMSDDLLLAQIERLHVLEREALAAREAADNADARKCDAIYRKADRLQEREDRLYKRIRNTKPRTLAGAIALGELLLQSVDAAQVILAGLRDIERAQCREGAAKAA